MAIWTIKGGRTREHEDAFLSEGVVALGYGLRQSIADFEDRDALRNHVENRTGADQLWRFYTEVNDGDMVALPRKRTGEIAIGRVNGRYVYQPDSETGRRGAPHTRSVEWQVTNIPRSHFDRDLLNSLGSLLTLSQPGAPNAEARIERIANAYLEIVPIDALETPYPAMDGGFADAGANDEIDLDREIRDRIIARLRQRFAGTRLEHLVASILRASGYQALETRQGADGGIDVLAGKGDLGFGEPRLCVQVKGRNTPVDLAEYDRLRGNITTFRAQHGLMVSLGGFTKPVHDRNEQSFFEIRLWGPDELAQRLLENYDALPQDIRVDVPLETVRVLRQSE